MTCLKLINMTCLLETTCEFWLWTHTKKTWAKTALLQLDFSLLQKVREQLKTMRNLCVRSVTPILSTFLCCFIHPFSSVAVSHSGRFCCGRNGNSSPEVSRQKHIQRCFLIHIPVQFSCITYSQKADTGNNSVLRGCFVLLHLWCDFSEEGLVSHAHSEAVSLRVVLDWLKHTIRSIPVKYWITILWKFRRLYFFRIFGGWITNKTFLCPPTLSLSKKVGKGRNTYKMSYYANSWSILSFS